MLDEIDPGQELAESPQAGRVAQDRAGRIAPRCLEPGQEILERLAVQAKRIGLERLDGQLIAEGPLPPAQEDGHILDVTLNGFSRGSLPPAGRQRVLGEINFESGQYGVCHGRVSGDFVK